MCCSKQIGTFRTAHNIIMSNKQPWRFLLYSWGILREPPHFCVDESVYNHPNNWPHFVPQKVPLTRSEWSFFYSGKNKEIQRVPTLRVFWDLGKTVLHETRVSGTALWSPTNAKFPHLHIHKPKNVVVETALVIFV